MDVKKRNRAIGIILTILLLARISSYFTLFPGDAGSTRAVKTVLRLALTFGSLYWLLRLRANNWAINFEYRQILPLGLYCAYLFLGLCSAFWSSDPGYTLLQWFMVAEGLVFAWAFYEVYLYSIDKYPGNPTLAGMFTRSLLPTMIVFLVGVVVDPDLFYRQTHGGEVSRLGGYIINPNELGMLAGVAIAAVCTEILDRRNIVLNVITGLVSAVALYMTESRSSMMAFVLVGGLAGWLAGRWKLRLQMFGGLFLALPLVWAYLNKKGDSDEIMNATGRIPFWTDLIMDAFPKEPILGYGFMRINYEEKYDSLHSYAAGMCHNAFIQVIINLGLLGATIIFFQMVTTFVGIARSPRPFVRRYSWLMLAPLIINSMTEFGIFGENNYGILFYQLILLQLCIEYAERK